MLDAITTNPAYRHPALVALIQTTWASPASRVTRATKQIRLQHSENGANSISLITIALLLRVVFVGVMRCSFITAVYLQSCLSSAETILLRAAILSFSLFLFIHGCQRFQASLYYIIMASGMGFFLLGNLVPLCIYSRPYRQLWRPTWIYHRSMIFVWNLSNWSISLPNWPSKIPGDLQRYQIYIESIYRAKLGSWKVLLRSKAVPAFASWLCSQNWLNFQQPGRASSIGRA